MNIKDEIKQDDFADEYHKLLINQLFTGSWVADIVSKHLKQHGLTSQQYNVLRILRGQKDKPIGVNAIAERMIDKMSNVSRLIDKLKKKDLVSCKTNKTDRRHLDISINSNGLKILKEIDSRDEELFMFFRSLTTDEAEQLNFLLDKMRS